MEQDGHYTSSDNGNAMSPPINAKLLLSASPSKPQVRVSTNTPHRTTLPRCRMLSSMAMVLVVAFAVVLSVSREAAIISEMANENTEHSGSKMPRAADTSSASTSLIDTLSCKPNDKLPTEWCMDEKGTPRYVGLTNLNGSSSIEIKRYNHKGFEQCLANKTIVFIGDSRVRYQLMNLAGFLKKSSFMKCRDYENVTAKESDTDCYLIKRKSSRRNDWTTYYKESTIMLNSKDDQQLSLCDCYREEPFVPATTIENRFIKRKTASGVVNLIYLQNFVDAIQMNQDYPPYSSFWSNSTDRCKPGECSPENRTVIFTGDTNNTLWGVLPRLNATHAFVSQGWEEGRSADTSCTIQTFQDHHPNIEMYLIGHPAVKDPRRRYRSSTSTWFYENKLECKVRLFDRQTMCKDVSVTWFTDGLHVLSILNEEFNHRLIETICPMLE